MYLVSKTQHRQLVLFVVRIIFSNHPDTFSTWIIRIRGSDIVANNEILISNFNVSCQIPNTWLYRQNIYVCMFQMQNDWLTMKNKEKEKLSRRSQWGSSLDRQTARNFNPSSKKARETLTVKISACQNLSFRECQLLLVVTLYVSGLVAASTNISTEAHVPTPRYGHYLTHAHNHITPVVAAMDSCVAPIGAHQHGVAARSISGQTRESKTRWPYFSHFFLLSWKGPTQLKLLDFFKTIVFFIFRNS